MLRRLKEYARPGAATALNGEKSKFVSAPQPFSLTQRDTPESRNRNNDLQRISQMRANISLELAARIQEANLWISSPPPPGEGAILKIAPGDFISKPKALKEENQPLYRAAENLNAKVCLYRA